MFLPICISSSFCSRYADLDFCVFVLCALFSRFADYGLLLDFSSLQSSRKVIDFQFIQRLKTIMIGVWITNSLQLDVKPKILQIYFHLNVQVFLVLYKIPISVQRLTGNFTNMNVLQEPLCLPLVTSRNQIEKKRKRESYFKKSIEMRLQCVLFLVENNVKNFSFQNHKIL